MLQIFRNRILSIRCKMSRVEAQKILSVDHAADGKAIRESYISIVKTLHPDTKDGDNDSFIKLTEAYQILSPKEPADDDIDAIMSRYRDMKNQRDEMASETVNTILNEKYDRYRQKQIQAGIKTENILSEEEYKQKVSSISKTKSN